MAYIKNTVKNVQGTSIGINDSLFKKDIQLEGDTYQYTNTGKQLFDKNGTQLGSNTTSFTILDTGIRATNTSAGNYRYKGIMIPNSDELLGKQVTLSATITPSASNQGMIALYFGSSTSHITNISGGAITSTGKTTVTIPSTYPSGADRILLLIYSNYTGTVNVNDYVNYTNLQLEYGNTQTSYEPYTAGASPNPTYPQDIEIVTGRQEIQVGGKNYIDGKQTPSDIPSELTITKNDDGSYTVNGTISSTKFATIVDQYNLKIPAGNYVLSIKDSNGNTYRGDTYYYYGTTQNYQYKSNNDQTYTFEKEVNRFRVVLYIIAGTYSNVKIYFQLEKGNTSSSYEKYIPSNFYEINLGKNILENTVKTTGTSRGITFTYNEDGSYTLNGTNDGTGNSAVYISNNANKTSLKAGRYYTLNTPAGVTITCAKTGGGYQTLASSSYNVFDLSVDTTMQVYIQVANGVTTTFDNVKVYPIISKTPVSDYTPYFTPIELCEIDTYKDRIFKTSGKNLFDDGIYNLLDVSSSATLQSNGYYQVRFPSSKTIMEGQFEENTQYTISSLAYSGSSGNAGVLGFNYTDGTSEIKGINQTTPYLYTITSASGKTIKNIKITYGSQNITYMINLQLEKGNQATSYEPYSKNEWYIEKNTRKVELAIADMNNGTDYPGWKYQTQMYNDYPNWNGGLASKTKYVSNITTLSAGGVAINTNSASYSPMWLPKGVFGLTQEQWKANYPNLIFVLYYGTPYPYYEKITNQELITQLNAIQLQEGVNNISVSSGDLSSPLNLTYYSQENPYADVIYSEDDENDIKVWFNDVELENAGDFIETLTMTSRILPNDASKRFTLSSFVSKELELTIHDIDLEDIQDQVKISIGTLVNGSYDYIPIGVFNIQDTPVNNHDKYIIKLRDNRVKFDFGYNAKNLIENQYIVTTDTNYLEDKKYYQLVSSAYVLLVEGTDYEVGDAITGTVYQKKGTATKRQIFDDILSKANVETTIEHFDNEDDEVGIYDNTINANVYIAYIAEQAGCIATIDRDGKLTFKDLVDLYVWKIPLTLMSDDYRLGTPFEIERVVYESGVIKYETSSDETLDTLYLDGANPYISTQTQVNNIFSKLENFTIDSVTTNNFLGNPAIDPYDIIEVYGYYDNNDNFVDDDSVVVFRTLANMFYTFNGKHAQTIDTQIGLEARTENVTKSSEATFKKWATTSIDNVNAAINLQAGRIDNANENIAQLQINADSISSQVTDVTNDLQNQITTQQTTITQTADALLVEQSKTTNLQSAVTDLQSATETNSQQLNTMSNYMLYQNGILTLGETNSNFKLELEGGENGEIRFMGNGVKLGYFNSERLYVENTTVFNEQVIAKKGDEDATNYYWHVTDDGCLDLDYGGTEE